jgi:hypothetical protein
MTATVDTDSRARILVADVVMQTTNSVPTGTYSRAFLVGLPLNPVAMSIIA